MATIENFLLKFKVDGQQAIDGASNSVKNLTAQVGGLSGGLGRLVGGFGGVVGIAGAAGGAFAALGMKAIALADEIGDISDATGISAGALLNFKQSLIEAGGKADDFATLAAKLNQNIGDAAEGSDKAQKAFRNLGVYVTDAGGKVRDTEVILRDAIDRIAAIEDPSRRAAAAVDLFGKSAAKLDFTKLSALKDPIADADIKRLAEYQTAIDKIRNSLETKLISFFGQLALDIDNATQKFNELEKQANARGNTRLPVPGATGVGAAVVNPFGIGAPAGERPLTAKEQEALRIKEMERLMAPAAGKPRGRTEEAIAAAASAGKGGFGAESDAMRKRRMEIEATSGAFKLQNNLLIDNINLEKSFVGKTEEYVQVERAREEVIKRAAAESAKLQDAKKALGKDEGALAKIYDDQIAKIVQASQVDADRVATATQGLLNLKTIEAARLKDIENTNKAIEDQISRQQNLGEILRSINDQQKDVGFQADQQKRSPLERQMAEIQENARRAALEAGRSFAAAFEDTGDGMTPERAQEFADGLAKIAEGYQGIAAAQTANLEASLTWEAGWKEAFDAYAENANNAALQAKTYFETFTSGMENALVKFVQTGKLSFKDLANSIIADFIRIQTRKAMVGLFGGGGFFGSLFGMAAGGPTDMSPMIVGERGPELFIPNSAGRIVPNNQLGASRQQSFTEVTYNIQAVDATSFRQLVAKDPQFIYAVTEKGRRSQPQRSR